MKHRTESKDGTVFWFDADFGKENPRNLKVMNGKNGPITGIRECFNHEGNNIAD